jgi:nucleoside-diphosphate-sugar epimerase
MRVGVTGGAGFIGQYVVEELVARGHEVVIFDHLGRGIVLAGHVEVMLGDTRDDVAVTELAAHVDGIIHLASVLGTQETVFNPRPAVTTNIESGLNVFEAAAQYDLPMVNIAVGNAGMNNPYSASKTCVESLGLMFAKDRKPWSMHCMPQVTAPCSIELRRSDRLSITRCSKSRRWSSPGLPASDATRWRSSTYR